MIGYILVWLGTLISVIAGHVLAKPWLDKRLSKPAQKPQPPF
jgi:hypothetical protein